MKISCLAAVEVFRPLNSSWQEAGATLVATRLLGSAMREYPDCLKILN